MIWVTSFSQSWNLAARSAVPAWPGWPLANETWGTIRASASAPANMNRFLNISSIREERSGNSPRGRSGGSIPRSFEDAQPADLLDGRRRRVEIAPAVGRGEGL